MKILFKILCKIGIHLFVETHTGTYNILGWVENNDPSIRECKCCGKKQKLSDRHLLGMHPVEYVDIWGDA